MRDGRGVFRLMVMMPSAGGARRATAVVVVKEVNTDRDKKENQRERKFKEFCQSAVPLLRVPSAPPIGYYNVLRNVW